MGLLEKATDEEQIWNLVALGSAIAASMAVRQGLQAGWKVWKDEEPPSNPAANSVSWGEALTWTVAVGAAVGLGRLLAERGAAAGWRKARGHFPKGLE